MEINYSSKLKQSCCELLMDHSHFSFNLEGVYYEDASVPSIADLEKLQLPDFNAFGNELMDTGIHKIKPEPYDEPSLLATQHHFGNYNNFTPTPSTPLYSPAVTSNQSSPASYTDEDYSGEEDKLFARGGPFHTAGSPASMLNITDDQLAQYSARDINRLCKGCPEEVVKQLKKRRRTLKNRGYASNSRVRRLQQKNELESTKNQLQMEVQKLRQDVVEMRKQRDYYKNRAEVLARKAAAQK